MTFTELPWAVQINYPILATLQLLPLLDRSALSGLAARLGYDREKLDEWI